MKLEYTRSSGRPAESKWGLSRGEPDREIPATDAAETPAMAPATLGNAAGPSWRPDAPETSSESGARERIVIVGGEFVSQV